VIGFQKLSLEGVLHAVKVNDNVGHYFQTRKGVHQGDPLSPILFNIMVDMLAVLIYRAKEVEQIKGVVPNLVDEGPSIFKYKDDTISLWIMI
jgi:retron-type reverse transcriptase